MIDLVIIVIFSAVLVPLVEYSSGALRIVLGLAFVLFSPGYTLIAALFPRRSGLGGIERIALSFGLSIIVVSLIGLALNYMPWGIRLYPILISVLVFIVVMAAVAWYRRRKFGVEELFQVNLQNRFQSLRHFWTGQSLWGRVLNVLLVLAILGATGTLVYTVAYPRVGEKFSQFYVLDTDGRAENYPREVVRGESASVVLGIVNLEHQRTTYRTTVMIDGQKAEDLSLITLEHEEEWEGKISFTPTEAGPNQKVEFRLYKGESEEVYLTTHIWIEVKVENGVP